MIAEDGGVTSFHFEFTEWSHQIQHLQKAPGVMDHWVLGNSSHVLDLAFHLGASHQTGEDGREAALIGIQRHPDIVGQVSPRKVRCFLILPIGKRLAAGG